MEMYQLESIYVLLFVHQLQDFLVIMTPIYVWVNVLNLIMETKQERDLVYLNAQ